jgi:hypothetical protein
MKRDYVNEGWPQFLLRRRIPPVSVAAGGTHSVSAVRAGLYTIALSALVVMTIVQVASFVADILVHPLA